MVTYLDYILNETIPGELMTDSKSNWGIIKLLTFFCSKLIETFSVKEKNAVKI